MATTRRHARGINQTEFPVDYPNQHRFQNSDFFRGALFGISRAAFYNYLTAGLVPPPDAKHGQRNAWRETTIAAAVEAFAKRSIAA
ncbi:hypothetical protein [Bradyrhizobium sp. STM 3809]|uniref:hypothetical protein n=1 Tax=Bradyrhizobium sp. STM 3809 TaxID=551936 RepID=UPI0002408CCF|nr:hypothetical protein [Bradyrhizobium sp. STM 3809]CCD99985.1 hypothetical protein BRAS3809_3110009 [Bradyrhizobium sp. STM 3809]